MRIIGVDIGGTSLRIGLIDESGGLYAFEKVAQETVFFGDSIDALRRFVDEYISRHDMKGKIAGLAIALPGTLDKDKSVVLNLPNVAGFNEKPLKAILEKYFSFPVYLMKDVSALYNYDVKRFKLKEEGVIIGCYVGTGLGNAISIDGKMLEGSNGSAGELGHIPVWGADAKCGCGNIGCSEVVAAGVALSRIQQEQFPDIPISRLFAEQAEHPVLCEFVRILAAVISSEINILDPHTVILGGGVITMEGFPKSLLEERIRFHARKPQPEKNLQFIYSDNPGENGVIGAGVYAWKVLNGGIL